MKIKTKLVFVFQPACLCPNSCAMNDGRQMGMTDRDTPHNEKTITLNRLAGPEAHHCRCRPQWTGVEMKWPTVSRNSSWCLAALGASPKHHTSGTSSHQSVIEPESSSIHSAASNNIDEFEDHRPFAELESVDHPIVEIPRHSVDQHWWRVTSQSAHQTPVPCMPLHPSCSTAPICNSAVSTRPRRLELLEGAPRTSNSVFNLFRKALDSVKSSISATCWVSRSATRRWDLAMNDSHCSI